MCCVQFVGAFGTEFSNSVCNSDLRGRDGDEAQIDYSTAIISFAFRRASERSSQNFKVFAPGLRINSMVS